MTSKIRSTLHLLRPFVKRLYDTTIREHLPRKLGLFNGVIVRGPRLLDSSDVLSEYEAAIVNSLRKHVTEGDEVTIVGGGLGVSTVVAARLVGEGGKVTTFEAGTTEFRLTREALDLNRVADQVTLHHGLVGPNVNVWSSAETADHVAVSELPACDVLEMDCEGAELDVLQNLDVDPRVIVVETHGHLGSPENDVRAEIERLGYEVIDRFAENAARGVFVLTAVRDE